MVADSLRTTLLAGILLVACFEPPNYEGKKCSRDAPCPTEYVCVEAGECRLTCGASNQCPSDQLCTHGVCVRTASVS